MNGIQSNVLTWFSAQLLVLSASVWLSSVSVVESSLRIELNTSSLLLPPSTRREDF